MDSCDEQLRAVLRADVGVLTAYRDALQRDVQQREEARVKANPC
jgi:hypothetical protein